MGNELRAACGGSLFSECWPDRLSILFLLSILSQIVFLLKSYCIPTAKGILLCHQFWCHDWAAKSIENVRRLW